MPQNLDGAAHTHYHIERTHETVSGLIAMPVAGTPPQSQVYARVHADYEVEVVTWGAVCEGAPPKVPSYQALLGNSNYKFLGGTRSGIVPVPLPNGAMAYSIAGVYRYAMTDCAGLDGMMPLGKGITTAGGASDQYVPAENFRTDLLNPNS